MILESESTWPVAFFRTIANIQDVSKYVDISSLPSIQHAKEGKNVWPSTILFLRYNRFSIASIISLPLQKLLKSLIEIAHRESDLIKAVGNCQSCETYQKFRVSNELLKDRNSKQDRVILAFILFQGAESTIEVMSAHSDRSCTIEKFSFLRRANVPLALILFFSNFWRSVQRRVAFFCTVSMPNGKNNALLCKQRRKLLERLAKEGGKKEKKKGGSRNATKKEKSESGS